MRFTPTQGWPPVPYQMHPRTAGGQFSYSHFEPPGRPQILQRMRNSRDLDIGLSVQSACPRAACAMQVRRAGARGGSWLQPP